MQIIYIENIVYKLFFWDCTRKKESKSIYCIQVANEKMKLSLFQIVDSIFPVIWRPAY